MKVNIKGVSRPTWLGALAVGLLTPLVVWSVVNVNTASIFELDGNAITAGSGDDWDQVASGTNLNATTTAFLQDTIPPAVDRIFTTGGSKDERDISGSGTVWKHTSGSPPDKNDLEHAFAAAYRDASTDFDLHIYFGADRLSNNGDSAVGFWFFQDNVSANSDGTFSGVHRVGDILVTSDFRNGGGVSVINVFKWVGGANPLQLLASGAPAAPGSGSTPFCLNRTIGGVPKAIACGIANRTETNVPAFWPGGYFFKGDEINPSSVFPLSTLFEGGINITQLLGQSTTCFSSFMAMSRTSASTTAQLKDFVVGAFPLCGISVAKSCDGQTTVSTDGEHFHNSYTVNITNTGAGPVFDASFIETSTKLDGDDYVCKMTEINGSPITPVNLTTGTEVEIAATLASQASATATIECDTLDNPFDNKVSAVAYSSDPDTTQNAVPITDAEVTNDPSCPAYQVLGALLISKQCAVDEDTGQPPVTVDPNLAPQVCVDITVTNDRTESINGVNIDDDQIPDADEPAPFNLGPKGSLTASKTFEDLCYNPTQGDDPTETNPGLVTFTDNASASGTGLLSGSTVTSATVTATCSLCPTCPDCTE